MGQTYYDILGVSKNANQNEIRAKFIALAKKYHSDQNVGLSENEIVKHENAFKEISEAYATLSNEVRRKIYDLELEEERRFGNIYNSSYDNSNDSSNNPSYNDFLNTAAKAYQKYEKYKQNELDNYKIFKLITSDIMKLMIKVPTSCASLYLSVQNYLEYIELNYKEDLATSIALGIVCLTLLCSSIKNSKTLSENVKFLNFLEEKNSKILK